MILYIDFLGVAVAALSGALLAARKEMDILGFIVLGVVTGIGGGTLRDLILDAPVFWVLNQSYLLVAVVASLVAFALARRSMNGWRRLGILWLDAAAMAFFASTGTLKALQLEAAPLVAITMGLLSAVAGGLIRDVIAQEAPFILRGEIYAFAAMAGGLCVVILDRSGFEGLICLVGGVTIAFFLRVMAISFGWKLEARRRSTED